MPPKGPVNIRLRRELSKARRPSRPAASPLLSPERHEARCRVNSKDSAAEEAEPSVGVVLAPSPPAKPRGRILSDAKLKEALVRPPASEARRAKVNPVPRRGSSHLVPLSPLQPPVPHGPLPQVSKRDESDAVAMAPTKPATAPTPEQQHQPQQEEEKQQAQEPQPPRSYIRPMALRRIAQGAKPPPPLPQETSELHRNSSACPSPDAVKAEVSAPTAAARTPVLSLQPPTPSSDPARQQAQPQPPAQPSPPPPPAPTVSRETPLCSSDAFYRGIELLNAALYVAARKPPQGQHRKTEALHAVAYAGAGAVDKEGEDDGLSPDDDDGVGLTFQALVATRAGAGEKPSGTAAADRRQRTLKAVSVLPLCIITDGLSLLVVDFNGSQKHDNYQNIRPLLPSSSARAHDGCLDEVVWLDWKTLAQQARAAESNGPTTTCADTADDEVGGGATLRCSLADATAAVPLREPPESAASPLHSSSSSTASVAALQKAAAEGEVHRVPPTSLPSPEQALKPLSFAYAYDPLVLFFPGPSQTVREALEDIAQAYLPSFLQSAYAGGAPVRGRWCGGAGQDPDFASLVSRPLRLWQPVTGPSVEGDGLGALYPAVHAAEREAAARAAHGALHLPLTVWTFIVQQRAAHAQASHAGGRSGPSLAKNALIPGGDGYGSPNHNNNVNPSLSSASSSASYRAFGGSGRQLGGGGGEGEDAVHGAVTDKSIKAPGDGKTPKSVVDRRLAWLAAAQRNAAATAAKTAPSTPAPQGGERERDGGTAVTPTRLREVQYTATLPCTGPPQHHNGQTCVRIIVMTPSGRLVLERGVDGQQEALVKANHAPVRTTTVGDVRAAVVSSALGRTLGLSLTTFDLVYGPGMSPLKDDEVIARAQVTMRLVRGAA